MTTRGRSLVWSLVALLALAVTLPRAGRADQVVADDHIVQGDDCIGLDCVNDEAFSTDTIRLKENNTRIRFDDTSTDLDVPNHDWELVANDSNSGGVNRFSIQDDTAVTVPLTIRGDAPTDALFVDATGKVGLGTSTPVATLHVAGDANVTGTLTVGAFDLASAAAADSLTLTGPLAAASIATPGDLDVAGDLAIAGTLNGRDLTADATRLDAVERASTSMKAGIIPISAFSKPRPTAAVTFQTPYGPTDVYVVKFTAVSQHGRPPIPTLVEKDAAGFRVALAGRSAAAVTEVQWFAQRVGE